MALSCRLGLGALLALVTSRTGSIAVINTKVVSDSVFSCFSLSLIFCYPVLLHGEKYLMKGIHYSTVSSEVLNTDDYYLIYFRQGVLR